MLDRLARSAIAAGLVAAAATLSIGCSEVGEAEEPLARDPGDPDELMATLPRSCAFDCGSCAEPEVPFSCPTLLPWRDLPHADACEAWDGTYPAVTPGRCTASEPSGDAARKAGPIPGGYVLPDGHPVVPAGREVILSEPDIEGGFPMSLLAIPGSRFVLSSDGGILDNVLRVLDVDALANGGEPVASHVVFPRPSSLYYGLAFLPPDRVLAAGGGDAVVYAFDLDPATGAIARAPSRDLALGPAAGGPWYAGAIAATADGRRLVVAPSEHAEEIAILSLEEGTYGERLATLPTGGSHAIFDVRLDPFDPAGALFYASDQSGSALLEIDAAAGVITRTIELARNPSQIAFLDERYLAVAEANSDSLAIVDRAAGEVAARVPVFEEDAPRGSSPSALSYDVSRGRLYATLAGVNAVEVYDVGGGAPPTVTPVGRVPTAWWPTAVHARADGSLVVLSGKGHGAGADAEPHTWGEGSITELMRGSVQHVPSTALDDLASLTAAVDAARDLAHVEGSPAIECPEGANDFPIPADPSLGPSPVIKHVIFIVRENKTYDAVMGDRPDLGDGDPSLILAGDPELQARIWQNARAIAGTFTNFDNFYTDAEQSLQGHFWTVFGRTTDYFERVWLTTWGRGTRPITAASTATEALPEERSSFVWLSERGVSVDVMGEPLDPGPGGLDGDYPGLVYAQNVPDTQKSCYIAGRIRVLCDLASFTYATQSNDHTYGGQAGAAAPEVYIAVNDEALGLLLDGLSHSPRWKDSLLIVTEDDPQDGGDHVDVHRSILLMASPWVRRGYVSHGHYDVASIHKLIAHVLGTPYPNRMVREAMLPLDAFTSTPDYTPFDYLPRAVAAPCNGDGPEAKIAQGWDFEEVDDQPGLSEQIERMMRQPRARGVRAVTPRR
jgi:hypothetical protein